MGQELTFARKAILITDNKRVSITLKGVLNKHRIDVESGYVSLHSVPMMKKIAGKTKNTAFIRNELYRYIREIGAPAVIIMDYHIDLSQEGERDPDTRLLLKTYIVSYLILSKGQGLEKLRGNFILLGEPSQMKELSALESNPSNILNLLSTKDAAVNSIIGEFRERAERLKSLISFKAIDTELPAGEMIDAVNKYLVSNAGAR